MTEQAVAMRGAPDDLARWEAIAMNGLRRGNHIRNLHKLHGTQRQEALRFFGMLEEQARQKDCPHLEYKGIDLAPITDAAKRWRCTYCGVIK